MHAFMFFIAQNQPLFHARRCFFILFSIFFFCWEPRLRRVEWARCGCGAYNSPEWLIRISLDLLFSVYSRARGTAAPNRLISPRQWLRIVRYSLGRGWCGEMNGCTVCLISIFRVCEQTYRANITPQSTRFPSAPLLRLCVMCVFFFWFSLSFAGVLPQTARSPIVRTSVRIWHGLLSRTIGARNPTKVIYTSNLCVIWATDKYIYLNIARITYVSPLSTSLSGLYH